MAGTMTVASKELRDQFGSRRFLILFGLIVVLGGLSAYQGVDFIRNNVGSSFVYIFSGARMSFSFIQIMVFFGPILGLALGFDAVNKERINGTLSMVLGQPIYRDSVINGKFIAGAVALTILAFSTIAIMCGITIPMLGFAPILEEALKIVALTLLTTVYLLLWLSLGILYSTVFKKTSTSILFSIATWMTFSIVITILAMALSSALVPLPAGDFRGTPVAPGGQGSQGGQRFTISPEYMEAMQERQALQTAIQRLSPTQLYQSTASAILGISSFGFGRQEFAKATTLGEALANNWANIAALAAVMVVAFAASYMMFLRTEIRPGD
ncbi:MAG TPA: ABC transporter permease subunit [Candidatus Krumholzibacteriaceae bacterium]|nr:ABC transporter permease subunit [Candidatus Krumholzibacteriaceae bacterium]